MRSRVPSHRAFRSHRLRPPPAGASVSAQAGHGIALQTAWWVESTRSFANVERSAVIAYVVSSRHRAGHARAPACRRAIASVSAAWTGFGFGASARRLGRVSPANRDHRERPTWSPHARAVFRRACRRSRPEPVDDRLAARGRAVGQSVRKRARARAPRLFADIGFAERPPAWRRSIARAVTPSKPTCPGSRCARRDDEFAAFA